MNPNSDKWKWYGGKGIAVCDQWDNFAVFLSDMGERPTGMTLDRINNDGHYCPENCRWATHKEQTRKQSKNKMSMELAVQMRKDREDGVTYAALGKKYNVSDTTAYRICHNRSWT